MVDVFDRHEVRFDPRLAGCSTFVRHSDYAALEEQLAERVKVKSMLLDFEDFINQPPQYEELRMVRDYRHELYRKWGPLCRAILSSLQPDTDVKR